jgi:SRSO17 transposase
MEAENLRWERDLDRYLDRFRDAFKRQDCRDLLPIYVRGQLSELPRKSAEPIALAAEISPRSLQQFLAEHQWDQDKAQTQALQIVAQEHGGPGAVGIFDETSFVKRGRETPGVQRQWCGTLGKVENCTVTVHLGYVRGDFRCLLNGALFLPESWDQDRARCRKAGIGDAVLYRPKWQIALELWDRATTEGIQFAYVTFDEGYGGKPEFLRALTVREQRYVGEVPKSFSVWPEPPRVTNQRSRRRGRGRPRKTPRVTASSRPKCSVEAVAAGLEEQAWQKYRLDDRTQGPSVWEVKRTTVTADDGTGLPGEALQFLVLRYALGGELKYFLSNAEETTPTAEIVRVGLTRHWVEQLFREEKDELGMDHYEGRTYQGLVRHLILSVISYLFLASKLQELRGEKPGVDGAASACSADGATGPARPLRPCADELASSACGPHRLSAAS